MFIFFVLDKNLEKMSVNYLFIIFLVGFLILFIVWEYYYFNIEICSDLGDFLLFCLIFRDLLYIFVYEYFVLYFLVIVIGLV